LSKVRRTATPSDVFIDTLLFLAAAYGFLATILPEKYPFLGGEFGGFALFVAAVAALFWRREKEHAK